MIDKRTYSDGNIRRIVATHKVDYELAQRAVFALGPIGFSTVPFYVLERDAGLE